ncbi:centrosomal protein [Clarias magur]|uniref:Centrosomal protein n=1 Tax=Clarias magur TaxID=1594786 RepID=A0A8J4U8J8_CLAMG|nr:centrosomal protein [Clarias magur]
MASDKSLARQPELIELSTMGMQPGTLFSSMALFLESHPADLLSYPTVFSLLMPLPPTRGGKQSWNVDADYTLITRIRQEYELKIKGLMPAELRQELEDTITSLKGRVLGGRLTSSASSSVDMDLIWPWGFEVLGLIHLSSCAIIPSNHINTGFKGSGQMLITYTGPHSAYICVEDRKPFFFFFLLEEGQFPSEESVRFTGGLGCMPKQEREAGQRCCSPANFKREFEGD